jgi:hypothetical protein
MTTLSTLSKTLGSSMSYNQPSKAPNQGYSLMKNVYKSIPSTSLLPTKCDASVFKSITVQEHSFFLKLYILLLLLL